MLPSLIFITLHLLTVIAGVDLHRRQKRYIVYPDAGPSRVQLIIGLGIPVNLKDQSVTVGTVIKFQYHTPANSSEYTSRIYGLANTVSRDMNGDEPAYDEDNDVKYDDGQQLTQDSSDNNFSTGVSDEEYDDDNALGDIDFDKNRRKRALDYTEGGIIATNDFIKGAELPLGEAIRRQEMIDQKYIEEEEPKKTSRWEYYKILEQIFQRYGYSGRPCLLRTICEVAAVPFTHQNGLLGEIGHILFTPSTTKDAVSHHTDNEYHAAERLGRDAGMDCEDLFPECEGSVLDTFTQIGVDTLHKFGLY